MGAIEINGVIVQGTETTKEFLDKMKLEETCVVVDGEELHLVSHSEGKIRLVKVLSLSLPPTTPLPKLPLTVFSGFQKKLRNAFYSKRRLAGKEYERLAVWHRAIDSGSNQPGSATPSDKRTSPDDDDLCQSEWQLL